jgi:hypothetical protein
MLPFGALQALYLSLLQLILVRAILFLERNASYEA